MIERHVTFNVLPDMTQEFVNLFCEDYRPAMASMPGFVKVDLLREQEDPTKYQMVIRFESMETAAAWRSSKAHQALKPKIKALYQGSTLQVYNVIA
jgi:antibiotic biosynthesis monooxygenase (ABM) superfamily enzyme